MVLVSSGEGVGNPEHSQERIVVPPPLEKANSLAPITLEFVVSRGDQETETFEVVADASCSVSSIKRQVCGKVEEEEESTLLRFVEQDHFSAVPVRESLQIVDLLDMYSGKSGIFHGKPTFKLALPAGRDSQAVGEPSIKEDTEGADGTREVSELETPTTPLVMRLSEGIGGDPEGRGDAVTLPERQPATQRRPHTKSKGGGIFPFSLFKNFAICCGQQATDATAHSDDSDAESKSPPPERAPYSPSSPRV